jgi:predicted flap endonuclease-1-like 5' DNA nuclease
MEPQVLPPAKPSVKRARKSTTAKTRSTTPKAKPGPKPAARGRKPGPKAGTRRTPRKPAAPARPANAEDLKFIQGLGAKIESLLNAQGVKSFSDLAKASQTSVKGVLEQAGPRFKNQDPKPLIDQAKLVKDEKWTDLEKLQAELMKGKKKPGPKASK